MIDIIIFMDIDETLFFTKAKIRVLDTTDKLIKTLTNSEYNTYEIKENEKYDFSEFINTELFTKTSVPNKPVIKELQELFTKTKETNSEVYLLTARQDFDDKDKFLEFLVKSGIEAGHKDDQKIHVIRAGNIPGFDNANKKYHIIKKMLEGNPQFKTVRLYDDSVKNLEEFKEIELDYPEMNVESYLITDGTISAF
jgi:hypothetical protein